MTVTFRRALLSPYIQKKETPLPKNTDTKKIPDRILSQPERPHARFRTNRARGRRSLRTVVTRIPGDPGIAIGCPVNPPHPFFLFLSPFSFLFLSLSFLFLFFSLRKCVSCLSPKTLRYVPRSSFAWRRGLSFALHDGRPIKIRKIDQSMRTFPTAN